MRQLTHILMTEYSSIERELLMMLYRDAADRRPRFVGRHGAEARLLRDKLALVEGDRLLIGAYGVYLWEDYLSCRDELNQWYQSNHKRRRAMVREA
jgi:hypothetical protein